MGCADAWVKQALDEITHTTSRAYLFEIIAMWQAEQLITLSRLAYSASGSANKRNNESYDLQIQLGANCCVLFYGAVKDDAGKKMKQMRQ
jgi:hypothetical protein